MATPIVALGRAPVRASRVIPTQHEAGAHNALTLALSYLRRGDLPAAQRKAAQALASIDALQLADAVKLAASKGYRLHRCVPMTGGDTASYWMIQRGGDMRFLTSMDDLMAALHTMQEWRPRSPKAQAEEGALRAALAQLTPEVPSHG